MGLGKTLQAIAWAEALLKTGHARTVVVVCPAALKSQWRQEWQRFAGRDPVIVDGRRRPTRYYRTRPAVLIMNYELLLRGDADDLLRLSPEAMILMRPSGSRIFATSTAQQVKRLRPPFRLVLTGTPMENRVQELTSLMDWWTTARSDRPGVWARS